MKFLLFLLPLCTINALPPVWFGSVKSQEELRFDLVHEQGLDRSCGLGTIASCLNLYWGIDVNEATLIDRLGNHMAGDGTVNMTTLQNLLTEFDFKSKGYKVEKQSFMQTLEKFAPLIVHYDRPDQHFALVLAQKEDWLCVVDPARGIEFLFWSQFQSRFSGKILVAIPNSNRIQTDKLSIAKRQLFARMDALEQTSMRLSRQMK